MIVGAKYAMLFRRLLMWPATVLYGTVLRVRHALYDAGVLRSVRPEVSTIAIGNLALGGTGKTPMLELVLRTLEEDGPVATLSRGYGRRTSDIHEVDPDDTAARSGDEPVQVKRNFPAARVFVGADRVKAIAVIQRTVPEVRAVVLDDALQHRPLNAGLNILLTTAQRPYHDDALLPAGTLRDLRSRARKAHLVVVTKCVDLPDETERAAWRKRLGSSSEQELFFAGIGYADPHPLEPALQLPPSGQGTSALVFTGIADPKPFVMHVHSRFGMVEHIAFADHHTFTSADLQRLADRYANFAAGPKLLITTEKDAARLSSSIAGSPLNGLPIGVIGMRTVILNGPERFADLIRHHVSTHRTHRRSP
ncbi:MAG: tetraacyldisaccharide 4'-kinase [Flavobacteriales bacterium]|nr:tetraacyldisaccharide 4'-kinase [Flavobacteriales bacterium]